VLRNPNSADIHARVFWLAHPSARNMGCIFHPVLFSPRHRISQTVGSGTYAYTNDVASALPVVVEENGPDGLIDYDYGLGLISESSSTFDYFYHVDGLGSIVGLTDDAGTLQQGYGYDSWGVKTEMLDYVGTENKFRYSGQALDPETLQYFLHARYYDSALAHLMNRDPLFGLASNPGTLKQIRVCAEQSDTLYRYLRAEPFRLFCRI
jgi:RHS repeat-associated protein